MPKPTLIVVTGRPGAGKTTFANALGSDFFMPVVSRDSIKEGYVHTFGKKHTALPPETNSFVNQIYVNTLIGLIDSNVSVVTEAAFQHKVWQPMLEPFMDKAQIYLLICKIDGKTALERFVQRGLNNSMREYFHGDKGVDLARKGVVLTVSPYDEPRLDVPTYYIDTTGECSPSIEELRKIILKRP